ncbi:hypothetical protein EHF33_16760 (plasmid) [Deinococcus psychrotolerans]|uniref:Lipoprotein n=1 Tax=Deinococcus psychrotolerans TaxID=2489213 RepID=A0A3G8YS30_9DEIO|nr:hypothetical protein [Deinococcus psychrotolerans]AZI44561.1 hypothetical protein EHF33_16760 [Deinococcus psychrotolerans]
MKTTYAASALPLLLLGSLLSACSQSNAATGGRPELPTASEVRHPAAPKGAPVFLSLLTEGNVSLYQVSVKEDATSTSVNPLALGDGYKGRTVPISEALPADAVDIKVSDATAKVVLLHWVMWQDKNNNGSLDGGESLPLLSHDRVVYADQAVNVTFQTLSPDMVQKWNFAQGWSRAAHYVYKPLDTQTYRRSLETNGLSRFELHQPTPLTSM